MPTYSYECKKCGVEQDVFHPMNTSPRVKCQVCGGRCKRLLGTGAGIIFKGSGFYETDYKKAPAKAATNAGSADKSEKSESKTTSESTAKSDSKSEAKSSTKKDS